MINVEKTIVPLLREQFPALYQEHGQLFILFMESYFRWMERHVQEVLVSSSDGFSRGDVVTQNNTRGVIRSIDENVWIVDVDEFGQFVQVDASNVNVPVSNGTATAEIVTQRSFNPLYWARHLPEIRDVDSTIDSFILQFKNKYLPDIQFTTATNKQLFIKHALDFYRAKGTSRAIDLFFKLVYGFGAEIYYPIDNVFRLSDNTWNALQYIEIPDMPIAKWFVNQTIIGDTSRARAFVERVVKVRVKTDRGLDQRSDVSYNTLLYISNVEGTFQTNELIRVEDGSVSGLVRMIGSLSEVQVTASRPGFSIGEDLSIQGLYGRHAIGRVTEIKDVTGAVEFELLDGGWGYSEDAQVIASDKVLSVGGLTFESDDWFENNKIFPMGEEFFQDNIEFGVTFGESVAPQVGTEIHGLDALDEVVLVASYSAFDVVRDVFIVNNPTTVPADMSTVVAIRYTNQSGGMETLPLTSVPLQYQLSFEVIGSSDTVEINYTISSAAEQIQTGALITQWVKAMGEYTQKIAEGIVTSSSIDAEATLGTIEVMFYHGAPRTNLPIVATSREYVIASITGINVGVANINSSVIDGEARTVTPGRIYSLDDDQVTKSVQCDVLASFGYLESAGQASFTISRFNQTFDVNDIKMAEPRLIDTALATPINAFTYAFLPDPSYGYESTIREALGLTSSQFSSIEAITVTNPSQGHVVDPFYAVRDPHSAKLGVYDYLIHYNTSRTFQVGELITDSPDIVLQPPLFVARIKYHNQSRRIIVATRLHLNTNPENRIIDQPRITSEFAIKSGMKIYSQVSRNEATVRHATENRLYSKTGLNALIRSSVFSGSGIIDKIRIVDSGVGYVNDEPLEMTSTSVSSRTASGIGFLGRNGISAGRYLNYNSFLSTDKYLHDSDYYQEYSYEIRTALPFNVYKDALDKVLHVAGTKAFGVYVSTRAASVPISSRTTTTQELI